MTSNRFYIGGGWIDASGREQHALFDPVTEAVAGQVALGTAADVDRAVAAAGEAFKSFGRTTRAERLDLLGSILSAYLARRDDLIDALVRELGIPVAFASNVQVGVGILHLQTAIEVLKDYAFERPVSARSVVRHEPIGVVGMVTPWNWPVNQILCKIAPAIATGNTIVHKPSEVTPASADVIAAILDEAGVPSGVYNMVHGLGPEVGRAIAAHPGIAMVSFTGSTGAGIDVAVQAAPSVKRVRQELGGKSPSIVLPGADLPVAVTQTIRRLLMNSGQTCHAPTRLLVHHDQADQAAAIARDVVAGITIGAPASEADMGPVVSEAQWHRIQMLIAKGIEEGATLVAGGRGRPDGIERGWFVKPTIFADVTPDMIIAQEEIFGPVLCIQTYAGIDEAVAIANDTRYGLAAYVQGGDGDPIDDVASRLEAGMVFLNGAGEDPTAPFGGYKMSGNGHEWGSDAFGEFLETKAVIGTAGPDRSG